MEHLLQAPLPLARVIPQAREGAAPSQLLPRVPLNPTNAMIDFTRSSERPKSASPIQHHPSSRGFDSWSHHLGFPRVPRSLVTPRPSPAARAPGPTWQAACGAAPDTRGGAAQGPAGSSAEGRMAFVGWGEVGAVCRGLPGGQGRTLGARTWVQEFSYEIGLWTWRVRLDLGGQSGGLRVCRPSPCTCRASPGW